MRLVRVDRLKNLHSPLLACPEERTVFSSTILHVFGVDVHVTVFALVIQETVEVRAVGEVNHSVTSPCVVRNAVALFNVDLAQHLVGVEPEDLEHLPGVLYYVLADAVCRFRLGLRIDVSGQHRE